MMGNLISHYFYSKDRRKMKYYQDIIKKHKYWDTRPMLRDDK